MKNAEVPLPGDIFAPAASRMYQMIVSVLSFVFQRDLQWQSLLLYAL
jgi:hypothetical protein